MFDELLGIAARTGLEVRTRAFRGKVQGKIPFAQREDTGLDTHERIFLVPLLHERSEARAHGDLGALANVTEQILLNRDVGDLFIMEWFTYEAQNLRRGFRERHTLSISFAWERTCVLTA